MRYAMFEQLETQNLILRKFRREDAECFYARVGGSEKVTRYMLWQPHKLLRESQESIEKILCDMKEITAILGRLSCVQMTQLLVE